MELDITKKEFIRRLYIITMEHTLGPYSDFNDSLQPEEVKYKGDFDEEGFELVPKQNFFGNRSSAVATGKYQEVNGKLIIEGEVNSFSYLYLVLYVLSLLLYGALALFVIYINRANPKVCLLIAGLFVGVYASAFAFHMWLFRRSTRAVRYQIERDLFYLTRNDMD